MPVLPSEEIAPEAITEKIAKDPSSATESTASDNSSHENERTPGKASAQDFISKGPAIPEDMPPAASKEELQAKAKELNQ